MKKIQLKKIQFGQPPIEEIGILVDSPKSSVPTQVLSPGCPFFIIGDSVVKVLNNG
jgi:hypothetical protein